MEITCPYSEIDLLLAKMDLDKKCKDDKFSQSLTEKLEEVFERDDLNLPEEVAKINGITTKDLADSPNRAAMMQEGVQRIFAKKLRMMVDWGLSDKEAWALVSMVVKQ